MYVHMHVCNVKEVEQYLVRGGWQLEVHLALLHTSRRYSDMRLLESEALDMSLGNSLLKQVPTGTDFSQVLHIPGDNIISLLCGFVKMMRLLRLITLGRVCTEPGPNMRDNPWLLDSHEELFPTDRSNSPLEQRILYPLH
jgi:hypothetical protein